MSTFLGITPRQRESSWLAVALCAAVLTITFRIGSLPLLQPDEGRNAEVAREMKESGAWLVPTYNGLTYLDKPAFYFKAVALSLTAFGDSELAARLPSVLFGFGLLGLTWLFCRHILGPRPAALTVLVIATNPLFISQARIVIFDIALATFTCLAIGSGFLAELAVGWRRKQWYLVGAFATGLATLVKGPVGLAIPLLVLIVFRLVERKPGALKRLFSPVNALVFLGVVLPWFVGVSVAHSDFPYYGLVEETFNRFSSGKFHRTAPFYYYLLVLPATFFPWSLLLPEASLAAWKRWNSLPSLSRLAIVWCGVVVVFFSLSQSKLPGYILSASVPFGLLVAQLLDAALTHQSGVAARIVRRTALIFGLLGVAVIAALLVVAPQTQVLPNPLIIREIDLRQFSASFPPVIGMLLAVTVLAATGYLRHRVLPAVLSLALLPVLLVVLGSGVFQTVFEGRSARSMAGHLSKLTPETGLVFYRCLPNGLPFYLRRTGTLITTDGSEMTSNYVLFNLKNLADWPDPVVRVDEFDHWLEAQKGAVYLIAKDNDRAKLDQLALSRGQTVTQLAPRFWGVLLPAIR